MTEQPSLTVPQKLLVAAYELEERGRRPFSAEDLVVSAWRKFPDSFGLPGYRGPDGRLSYPDSNRVFAEIMGCKSVRRRGFLSKVGPKMYQLTEAGREEARGLSARVVGYPPEKAGLPRDMQLELQRLLRSKAVQKVRSSRSADLTFHDACAFWGISPWSSAIEFQGKTANFACVVEHARKVVENSRATFGHRGQAFDTVDLQLLMRAHHELLNKFLDEIAVIKNRRDERQ